MDTADTSAPLLQVDDADDHVTAYEARLLTELLNGTKAEHMAKIGAMRKAVPRALISNLEALTRDELDQIAAALHQLETAELRPVDPKDGIPFMITHAMRAQLHELSYSDEEIALLTPFEAHELLAAQSEGLRPFETQDSNANHAHLRLRRH
jgi:hypothetical protein